ncbi:beta-galactosidase [Zobellia uliginosa]|uniref:beta-galactosidase n=1 Tax=Zobellia uliginosa TaxID=143224 RepID=UPI0026E16899|nr:beta-galactosidase [Zobellia uliginosa]MDO6519007.1 beta-galactosidase [Zobellia uliginosa]
MEKRILNLFVQMMLIFCVGYSVTAQRTRIPKINIEDFTGTEEEARTKIDALNRRIVEAETLGIDATKEKMAVRLAEIFLFYANWDEKNKPAYVGMFDGLHTFHETTPQNLAEHLPTFERSEVITVLDKAMTTLNRLISGEISRRPIPTIDWKKITYKNNKQVYEGKPIFLADYTWQKDKAGPYDLTTYFGNYGSLYIDPNMVTNEEGDIASWVLNDINSKPSGNFGIMFIGHTRFPNWLETKYPDIRIGGGLFTTYDISSPGSREVITKLFEGIIPKLKGKKYVEQGYMLSNEPHWNLSGNWATVELSHHAKDSLRLWLKNKHKEISSLNALWDTNFSSFQEVDVTVPMPETERGKPIWYDLMKFNQDRTNNWFSFLHNEVKRNDPNAKTHIKLIPSQWGGNDRHHGLDFETLTSMTDHIGNDAGAKNSLRWGPKQDWENRYHFDWRNLSMPYDFFRSVSPNKVNYNSEVHFLQAPAFTDLFLEPNYVRSVYWLAVLQGMNSAQTWFWPRLEDGSLRLGHDSVKELAGSAINQPQVIHEITSTMMDINAHSEHIDALQNLKQTIRVFYSETSAINKKEHMDDVYQIYESLYFEGLPIGFATEKIIKEQNNFLWDVILVYKTDFTTKQEMNALQAYLDKGGTVIIDEVSLKKDEYGKSHGLVLNTNQGGKIIRSPSVSDMVDNALKIADSKGRFPNVVLEETNDLGMKGCVWRGYRSRTGDEIINIINIGKEKAKIDLKLKNSSQKLIVTDLLTNEKLEGSFIMEPETVYLLAVRERTDNDNRYEVSAVAETCPGKNNGKIEVVAELEQNYTAKLNDEDFDFTKDLTIEDVSPGVYRLCITVDNSEDTACYNLKVKEATTLEGKSTIASKKMNVAIQKGTPPFNVFVNDKQVYETHANSFVIDVENGDKVQVTTNRECEGAIEKVVMPYDAVYIAPNPSDGLVEIHVPTKKKSIQIDLTNLQSQLISSKVYPVVSGKVTVDLRNNPGGVYFATIMLDKIVKVKILKK